MEDVRKKLRNKPIFKFYSKFKISNSDSLGVNIHVVLFEDTVRRYYGIFLKTCGTFRKYYLVSKSEHFENLIWFRSLKISKKTFFHTWFHRHLGTNQIFQNRISQNLTGFRPKRFLFNKNLL